MAAGDAVQLGTAWKIGFGSFSYTGYMPESVESTDQSDAEEIPDERGATQSVILRNPRKELKATLMIKDTSGSIVPPAVGATVTLTPPEGTSTAYRCRGGSVRTTRGIAQLTLDLVKEDAMTYT